jgi:hypothetical protein
MLLQKDYVYTVRTNLTRSTGRWLLLCTATLLGRVRKGIPTPESRFQPPWKGRERVLLLFWRRLQAMSLYACRGGRLNYRYYAYTYLLKVA